MKEIDYEKILINFLNRSNCIVWKNDTQGTYDPSKKIYRKNNKKTGVSDIIGYNQDGKAIFIEVKTPENLKRIKRNLPKWTAEREKGIDHNGGIQRILKQFDFLNQARLKGCIAGFAAEIKDLKDLGF